MTQENPDGLNVPAGVTPYGLIAYRIDALANRLYEVGEHDFAARTWGIMDDLVALNLAQSENTAEPRDDCEVCDGTGYDQSQEFVRCTCHLPPSENTASLAEPPSQ